MKTRRLLTFCSGDLVLTCPVAVRGLPSHSMQGGRSVHFSCQRSPTCRRSPPGSNIEHCFPSCLSQFRVSYLSNIQVDQVKNDVLIGAYGSLAAGADTTWISLGSVIHFLHEHPKTLRKLQVDRHHGTQRENLRPGDFRRIFEDAIPQCHNQRSSANARAHRVSLVEGCSRIGCHTQWPLLPARSKFHALIEAIN